MRNKRSEDAMRTGLVMVNRKRAGEESGKRIYRIPVYRQQDNPKRIREDAQSSTMKNLVPLLCMVSSLIGAEKDFFRSVIKGCANESVCGANGAAASEGKFNFHIPAEDSTPNGVKCPTAYCIDTVEECNSTKEMDCTGSMNHCYDYREQVIDPGARNKNYSMKGCINSDACKNNLDNNVAVDVLVKKYAKCYTPSKFNNTQ
ncbi:uncharacterized protein ACNLHF_001744 isoform 2-T2 [Anomaloglossus baeobatrachus]